MYGAITTPNQNKENITYNITKLNFAIEIRNKNQLVQSR